MLCVCVMRRKKTGEQLKAWGGGGVCTRRDVRNSLDDAGLILVFRREKEKRETSIFRARESCLVHLEKRRRKRL